MITGLKAINHEFFVVSLLYVQCIWYRALLFWRVRVCGATDMLHHRERESEKKLLSFSQLLTIIKAQLNKSVQR